MKREHIIEFRENHLLCNERDSILGVNGAPLDSRSRVGLLLGTLSVALFLGYLWLKAPDVSIPIVVTLVLIGSIYSELCDLKVIPGKQKAVTFDEEGVRDSECPNSLFRWSDLQQSHDGETGLHFEGETFLVSVPKLVLTSEIQSLVACFGVTPRTLQNQALNT